MSIARQFDPKELDAAGRVLANVPKDGEDDSEWIEAVGVQCMPNR